MSQTRSWCNALLLLHTFFLEYTYFMRILVQGTTAFLGHSKEGLLQLALNNVDDWLIFFSQGVYTALEDFLRYRIVNFTNAWSCFFQFSKKHTYTKTLPSSLPYMLAKLVFLNNVSVVGAFNLLESVISDWVFSFEIVSWGK